jgi:sulfate/thiosulfate-binding protein
MGPAVKGTCVSGSPGRARGWRLVSAGLAVGCLAALFPAGCGSGEKPDEILVLAAYTTPREAYGKMILPAFQRRWQERTGRRIEFRESYLGSGAQSRAIVGGFEADIAALSLEADIQRIVEAGLITHDWKGRPYGGIVTTSVVVIAVREGNPLDIRDWADLARPGLKVLTPDPRTSGGAMWNVAALYGAALRGKVSGVPGGDPEAATQFLGNVFRNVSIMDKGARESITNFERGVGDVAITYENEVQVARLAGEDLDYVIPRSTLLIQNPVALIDAHVDRHGVREAAEAFIEFLWSEEAQDAFAQYGLRPASGRAEEAPAGRFPPVEDLWTIEYLGGWSAVVPELFGPDGRYTRLVQELQTRR